MANFSNLTQSEVTFLLNSYPEYGTVVNANGINHDYRVAGARITTKSNAKRINGFGYAAWLLDRLATARDFVRKPRSYEEIKAIQRQKNAEMSAQGRDIGKLPAVKDPGRRERCRLNLQLFLETYFPQTFKLAWSEDHKEIIREIEEGIIKGGLQAESAPRATGKTSILERAGIFAVIYGHRSYMLIIGASEDAASEILSEIKTEIEFNDILAEDFPEVCYPVRSLEGISNRCAGQLCCGERTRMTWGTEIVLPTIRGSVASGAIIKTTGITGRIRGMKAIKVDGTNIRPDFVLLDDPQTRESAESPEQCKKRMRTINGDVLGLGGPGVKISAFCTCTVIRPGDVADQILDAEKNPSWKGRRRQLLRSFPTETKLWKQYAEIWRESLRVNKDISEATEFYRLHRSEMDKGAVVSWSERYEPDEDSAIQYAMNLYIRDRETFFAEYQNAPMPEDGTGVDKIEESQVYAKLNNRPRGEVAVGADHLVGYIDVQKNLFYWVVMGFSEDFTSWVIDYSAFPEQKRRVFNLRDADPTYSSLFPGAGLEGAIYGGLKELCGSLLGRVWRREDGAEMKIERLLIDSGWGRSTDAIFQFCRESEFSAIVYPSKGMGITAAQRPISEYRRNQGDRIGFNWMIPNVRKKRSIRYIMYDTNFWKSFFRERLLTLSGDPGSLSIYGSSEEHHRMFAEQLTSETSIATSGRGRRVDIWSLLPGRSNHWLDCVVGCHVAASERGCQLMAGGKELSKQAQKDREAGIERLKRHIIKRDPRRFEVGKTGTGGRHFTMKK